MKLRTFLPLILCVCALAFMGPQPLPASAGEHGAAGVKDALTPSLGTGKIQVRLYTDYFCAPCRAFEPKAEPVILDLLKKNIITITFVDTPFHRHSALYTRYFLYILRETKEPEHLLRARNLLFAATRQDPKGQVKAITDRQKLEEYLTGNGLKFTPYDVKPVFAALEGLMKEDKIMETPVCVIVNGGKKTLHKGGASIVKALNALK